MKHSQPKLSHQTKKTRKILVILILVIVLVVGVLAFFASKKTETIKRIYYGHVTRRAYHKEYNNLRPALEGLGLSENKHAASICKVEEIATDGIQAKKVLFCGLQTDNYVEISPSNKQRIVEAATQLDELVGKNGGKVQTNIETTFSKYFTDISNGVDYNPDFGATFIRENYLCAVHLNVAFSNLKPPAYSIQFGCSAPRVTNEDNYLLPPCWPKCSDE